MIYTYNGDEKFLTRSKTNIEMRHDEFIVVCQERL
jgi:hypothetical protein